MFFRKWYSSWDSYGGDHGNSHPSLYANGKPYSHYWIEQLHSYRISSWLEDSGRVFHRVWFGLSEFNCIDKRILILVGNRISSSILKRDILCNSNPSLHANGKPEWLWIE
jgi:hypothetical protein